MRTSESTVSGARPSRHWKTAECSLSTGSRCASSPLPGFQGEVAGRDEALLVRERERHAPLERPQRRSDTGEAHDRVQDEVGLRGLEELGQVSADLDVLDAVRPRELVERPRAGRERADLEIRLLGDDLEGLLPDGAGGPEQRDPLSADGHSRKANRRNVNVGGIERLVHRYGEDASQLGELFLPDEQGRAVPRGRRHPRRVLAGPLRPVADDAGSARTSPRMASRPGTSSTGASGTAAAGRRRSSTSRPASTCSPSSTRRSISTGSAPSGTARAATSRSGRPREARLPAGVPGASPRVRPRAVVSQAGVCDLRLAAVTAPSDEPTRALLGESDVLALASPRELVPLGVDQLVLHGDRDETVAIEIARSYAAAAIAAGDRCELRVLPGVGHFEHIDASSEAWRIARSWLAERLRVT